MQQLEIDCESCGATLTVEAGERTTVCPYCDSPSVVSRPASDDRPQPVFIVGFVLDKKAAQAEMEAWIRSRWFTRSDFKSGAKVDKMRAVYCPAFLYGAEAHAEWSAEIGEDYTETYTDGQGRVSTRTRTEWYGLDGTYSTYVYDVIVTASQGVDNDELEQVEPFDMKTLRRYSPAMISGWIAEEPSVTVDEALEMARGETLALLGKQLRAFMPGDKFRNLQHNTTLHEEVTDLVILPLWVFAVRYNPEREPVRILINGQTGKAYGKPPRSWIKITGFVLACLAVVGGIVAAAYALTGGGGGY